MHLSQSTQLAPLPRPTATVFVLRLLERYAAGSVAYVEHFNKGQAPALVCFTKVEDAYLFRDETKVDGISLMDFADIVSVSLPSIMGGYERYILDGTEYARPDGAVFGGKYLCVAGVLNIDTCRFVSGGLPTRPSQA